MVAYRVQVLVDVLVAGLVGLEAGAEVIGAGGIEGGGGEEWRGESEDEDLKVHSDKCGPVRGHHRWCSVV